MSVLSPDLSLILLLYLVAFSSAVGGLAVVCLLHAQLLLQHFRCGCTGRYTCGCTDNCCWYFAIMVPSMSLWFDTWLLFLLLTLLLLLLVLIIYQERINKGLIQSDFHLGLDSNDFTRLSYTSDICVRLVKCLSQCCNLVRPPSYSIDPSSRRLQPIQRIEGDTCDEWRNA